jgi:hypothetical protein
MRIATVGRSSSVSPSSVASAVEQVIQRLDGEPDFLLAFHTADAGESLMAGLAQELPEARYAGCSSCQGVMTDEGLFGFGDAGFALWAVRDPDGAYGAGFSRFEAAGPSPSEQAEQAESVRKASRQAYRAAVAGAHRPGELPELLWVMAVPGTEEAVLAGLNDITGGQVPIAGGSAADDTIAGGWTCFAGRESATSGVVVVALFPSTRVASSFQSGYEPAGPSGLVTRAEGRVLFEIDGLPAAQVYDRWAEGLLTGPLADGGGTVLALTSMSPLGREVGRFNGDQQPIPYYSLIHPERVTPDQALTLFAEVAEGQRLHLMRGSIDSLTSRAGRVADAATSLLGDGHRRRSAADLAGALVIYCAGCMLAVGDDLPRVTKELGSALGGVPFAGAFTFGEQGCFLGGENAHGNLMISVAVLER